MSEPLFLKTVFKERIWGGNKLFTEFGYNIPTDTTGECWGISAHTNGPSEIVNGPLKGKYLDEVWKTNPELFGHFPSKEFPLLTKILDARTELSVQVHPDDRYAQKVEKVPYGKSECWYVIKAEPGAEIVYGHHAQSPEEFREMSNAGGWDKLLRKLKVKSGDFFYVPSGTIHAIGGGILILETQQSSDITYRVYDYDRKDLNGLSRDLHIESSISVTTFPHLDPVLVQKRKELQGAVLTELVSEKNFTVYDVLLDGKFSKSQEFPFLLVSILDGEGQLTTNEGNFLIKKGDHFILPATIGTYTFDGRLHAIASRP
ncbi:mannose-6-phosphate isomerase, class I [Pullulanibacillus sp. KACC 23026]|uniref:mannose-6-phosphate isomerase, class I n=1 Tax=Pullulanibacillus sp. KACC 23026 TaxID=3028315 RepID=UPI0023AFD517|nr:mannose-6-phosphate isomerase, class I [Pullulanibacillus sp. KACC 23026]WEG13377.1 mannose-6-phosphate isomerase, class I [Pullulanibacillus sp. KACC 23026]